MLFGKMDGLETRPMIVMPDTGSRPVQALIRHPELLELDNSL
jgi:hypothetical protein